VRITDETLRLIRARAHVHGDRCFSRYEPCGEHHMHDDTCGSRPIVCGYREDRELALLLAAYEGECLTLDAVQGARENEEEQLTELRIEISRMRAVYKAAKAWFLDDGGRGSRTTEDLRWQIGVAISKEVT
jgi:hypothetical protein